MNKKLLLRAVIPTVLLIAVSLGCLIFHQNYVVISGNLCQRDVRSLDLSGQTLTNVRGFSRLQQLEELDLTGTGITAEDYAFLRQQLPDCDIRWELPFQGTYLSADTRQITITQLSQEDIALLDYLPQLESVDATGCKDYEAILALQSRYPGCKVYYNVTVGGTELDQDAESAASDNIEEITSALALLPKLKELDATGCGDLDSLLTLQAQYPQCGICYLVNLAGESFPNDTNALTVSSATAQEIEEALKYLPQLTSVTVTQPVEDQDAMLALCENNPDIAFTYSFPLLGQQVSNRATELDFSNTPMESTQELEALLPHFVCLEKVDMCNCGISNEEMGALNERHPETLFVWSISFGKFSLRTDITSFMPFQYGYQVTDRDADKLKYFTEIMCLDFGHMPLTRTDFLGYMTKLEYLIIADTPISDITSLSNLSNLKFLEIFMTDVTDFSPLVQCKNLVDLNICYTNPESIEPFCQMTWLEHFWFQGMWRPDWMAQLNESLPNTQIMYGGSSSTGFGWRDLPNYFAQRDILGMPYMTG